MLMQGVPLGFALDIVKDLAAVKNPCDEYGYCILCSEFGQKLHKVDCPWRRAKELIERYK